MITYRVHQLFGVVDAIMHFAEDLNLTPEQMADVRIRLHEPNNKDGKVAFDIGFDNPPPNVVGKITGTVCS